MATSLQSPALRFAANEAILTARRDLAKVSMFSTNFTAEAAQPGETLMVPIFDDGEASEFDKSSNNYGDYDGSVRYVPVSFNKHPKKSFGFSEKDFTLVNGTQFWQKSGEAGGRAVGRAILKSVSGLINKTNVKTSGTDSHTDSEGTVTGTGLPFSAANEYVVGTDTLTKNAVTAIRTAASANDVSIGDSVLMLNGAKFGEVLALLDAHAYGGNEAVRKGIIPDLYGFRAIIENDELTTTAGENLVGAIVPVNAVAVASRILPVLNPKLYEEIGTTTDEASGLTLQIRRGGSWETGDAVFSVECLFGAKLLQPTKIIRLVSAATNVAGPTGATGATGDAE